MKGLVYALVVFVPLASSLVFLRQTAASPGATERVSVDSAGNQANNESYDPALSGDGRFVAFQSYAYNLVLNDTNNDADVFVHDRQTGATERVSVASAGNQANTASDHPAISADGRYVAFETWASNLVPGDTNAAGDVFVHDRQTGLTERVSVDSAGNQGNGSSGGAAMSGDGRYVAFSSDASNLVAGDTNNADDIFVHDRQTGATERVSVDSAGNEGNGPSFYATASGDGRFVAFRSEASDLVAGDTNTCGDWFAPSCPDIFVHDRQTGATTRVSVDSAAVEGNDRSEAPAISADGRYVAFWSEASNLVPGDTNVGWDVFVHDRQTGATERVSVDSAGNQANTASENPAISADGRYVAFESSASNLVPGDTNVCGEVGGPCQDVFVHDRQTGATERVSVDSAGNQANNESCYGGGVPPCTAMSADGRYVAFESKASNLVPNDTNGRDIFVHDRGPVAVGGIAELPALAATSAGEPSARTGTSGWSAGDYAALAGGFAAAAVLITVAGRYARRRWFGRRS
jgi:Tol biopolymer transport system component